MSKFKVMAGMLFSFEGETEAADHKEAADKLMEYIEGVYKDDYVEDEKGRLEFIRPTTIIVTDEDGNAQDFQFSDNEEEWSEEEEAESQEILEWLESIVEEDDDDCE